MKIELKEIPIRDIVKHYVDNEEDGVIGYDGKLNIRPKFQREFVYDDKKREEVINTIKKGFPLNTMYWIKNDDGTFEVLDGQQRTISFCQYVSGVFSVNYQFFHNLTKEEQEDILNYKCMVYECSGTDKEKLEWFKIINIAGEKLTTQELRNSCYTGEWLTDAKKYFSKTQCAAYGLASKYVNGKPIRQEYLETVLKWIANKEECEIEDYMAKHQKDTAATPLWTYFQKVINWVQITFPKYRKEMKGHEWGVLYNTYHDQDFDVDELETKIEKLMKDPDVTNKKGIYPYVLSGDEKTLSIRTFDDNTKREVYEEQKGVCPKCGETFEYEDMEGDHITPWSKGGKTIKENCQMLCKGCNRTKSNVQT